MIDLEIVIKTLRLEYIQFEISIFKSNILLKRMRSFLLLFDEILPLFPESFFD